MKDIIVWLIHTPAGIIAILCALISMHSQKGSDLHRKVGRYFTISMLIMLFSGTIAATLKNSLNDIFLGILVFYTVFTAWLTTHHKKGEITVLEYLALIWIVIIGITAYFANRNHETFLLWMILAIFFVIGDLRNILQKGLNETQRLVRHVWRIGFSLAWAGLALTDKMIKILGGSVEEKPYIAIFPVTVILAITFYWIKNILFSLDKKQDNSNK